MKQLTINEALGLSRASTSPSISIYLDIDSNTRTEPQSLQRNLDRLLRNLESLVERSFDRFTSRSLLPSLKAALQRLPLPQNGGGLAIYHKNGFTGYLKMPSQIRNLAIAAHSFHIKPVMRCAQLHRAYYLVVFRKNVSELWLIHPERTQKVLHVKWSRKSIYKDNLPSVFSQTQMTRFCHKMSQLYRTTSLPVLLAGPSLYQDTFQKAALPWKFETFARSLTGSIDHLEINSLVHLAQPIVSDHFRVLDDQKVEEFHKAASVGLTSTNIHEIAQWVVRGQVATLLIAEDRHIWGALNRATGDIEFAQRSHGPSTDDLLDDLAEIAYSYGDSVVVLPTSQMPKGFAIAAIAKPLPPEVPILRQANVLPLVPHQKPASEVATINLRPKEPMLHRRAEL